MLDILACIDREANVFSSNKYKTPARHIKAPPSKLRVISQYIIWATIFGLARDATSSH